MKYLTLALLAMAVSSSSYAAEKKDATEVKTEDTTKKDINTDVKGKKEKPEDNKDSTDNDADKDNDDDDAEEDGDND